MRHAASLALWALAGCLVGSCASLQTLPGDGSVPYLRQEFVGKGFYDEMERSADGQAFLFRGVIVEPRPTPDFPAVWGEPPEPPAPGADLSPGGPRRILAVMEIEVRTPRLSAEVAGRAVDYLRTRLTATRRFAIVDASRQQQALRELLAQQKKESFAPCYDDACQVPLGKALAADTILRSTLSHLGEACTLSCELIDLAKEAALGGGLERFDCHEAGLVQAIERLVPRLAAP